MLSFWIKGTVWINNSVPIILLIIMDSENEFGIRRIIESDPEGKIKKLLSFAGDDGDIDDPWYTGEFERAYEEIERGCLALAETLE